MREGGGRRFKKMSSIPNRVNDLADLPFLTIHCPFPWCEGTMELSLLKGGSL